MRRFVWNPYQGRGRPTVPLTLMQIAHGSDGVAAFPDAEELDALCDLSVGESHCIPVNPQDKNDPTKPQLGDFTRVE